MFNNAYCLNFSAQSAVKVVGRALYIIDLSAQCAWAGGTSFPLNRDPPAGLLSQWRGDSVRRSKEWFLWMRQGESEEVKILRSLKS